MRRIPRRCLFFAVAFNIALVVQASQSPPGCSANNVQINFNRNATSVTNGASVTFTVTVGNHSSLDSCDVTLGPDGLVLTAPGPDGNATGPRTTLIPGGTTLCGGAGGYCPAVGGFGPITFTNVCVINITNGAKAARATLEALNQLLHENISTDDPQNFSTSISLNVLRPSITVTKQPLSAVPISSTQVRVTYSGSVSNSGDILLQYVKVLHDQPSPNTVLTNITILSPGAVVWFTNSYVTSNIASSYPGTITGYGTAPLDTPVNYTNSAQAASPLQLPLSIQATDGGVVLQWTNTGVVLQSSPDPSGPFTTLNEATSPYADYSGDTQKFYRLLAN